MLHENKNDETTICTTNSFTSVANLTLIIKFGDVTSQNFIITQTGTTNIHTKDHSTIWRNLINLFMY